MTSFSTIAYEEYQAAKQWFIDVGEAGEWPLFGDVYIEHVVEEQAFGNRSGSQGTILGPFHLPDAPVLDAPFELPHRSDESGDRTRVSGRVTDVDGRPLANANLDIWQADAEGRYSGFMPGPPEGNLRGQVRTDADGRYELHYAIDGGRIVNFLAVVRVPNWANEGWMEECSVSDAVEAFAGWHPAVTEMVGATEVGARWALHDLEPLERWHTDRVVLMGDAAHAMVPHQGQGANQTIEDAIALADCLADAQATDDPASALRRYAERRRRRTVAVQWLSRRTADLMHLPDGPEIPARDALFADLYAQLSWIHRHDAHADHREIARAVPVGHGRA